MQKLLLLLLSLSLSLGLYAQFEVPVEKPKTGTTTPSAYATWLVKPDVDCYLNLNGSYYGSLKGGEYNKVGLKKGVNVLEFKRSASGEVEKEEIAEVENTDQGLLKVTLEKGAVVGKETVKEKAVEIENKKTTKEIEMVYVEGGTFTMGCTSEQSGCGENESPTHRVTLSSYSIGKYEVTQAQWRAVMGNNPSEFSGCDNCPVENVSWEDIEDFIEKLNAKTGKHYRLPTEAEWEYAARGGNKSQGYKYSGSNSLSSVAWNEDNGGDKTHPVGEKTGNELGIYDMSGNVYEWCADWYGDYSSSSQTNPKGPSSGWFRVLRGGSWNFYAQPCRVSYRRYNSPTDRYDGVGFRLVLVP